MNGFDALCLIIFGVGLFIWGIEMMIEGKDQDNE